jgi:hypothetical protein
MKKILLIFSLTLYAKASFFQMLKYYQSGQDYNVLKEAKHSAKEYQNPNLHLLWAKSAEKLGKLDIAMAAYERVLILDSSNQEAKNALKNIYATTHRKGLSVTPNDGTKKNKLKLKANLTFGHDSNVNANASGDNIDGYYGTPSGAGSIASSFARVAASASYLYNFVEYDNWFTQSTFDFYYQNNYDAHLYDLTLPTAEIALGYIKNDYLFYFPISYNNIHYLNKNLLNIFSFIPHVRVKMIENILVDTSAIYTQQRYIDNIDKSKNAITYGLQTGIYWTDDQTQLHFNIKYENRIADANTPERYIDADFFTFDTNFKYYFTSSFISEAHYLFRYSNYKDDIGTKATPSQISRDDYINELNIKLSYLLNKDMEVYAQNTYTKSLSTYIPAEYNKNVLLLGLQIRY